MCMGRIFLLMITLFYFGGCTNRKDQNKSDLENAINMNCQFNLFTILAKNMSTNDRTSFYRMSSDTKRLQNNIKKNRSVGSVSHALLNEVAGEFPTYIKSCNSYSLTYGKRCMEDSKDITLNRLAQCVDLALTQFSSAFYFWKQHEMILLGEIDLEAISIPSLEEAFLLFSNAYIYKKQKKIVISTWQRIKYIFLNNSMDTLSSNQQLKREVEYKIELLLYLSPLFLKSRTDSLTHILKYLRNNNQKEWKDSNLNIFKFSVPKKITKIKGVRFGKGHTFKIPKELKNTFNLVANEQQCVFSLDGVGVSCIIPPTGPEVISINMSRKSELIYSVILDFYNLGNAEALKIIETLMLRYGDIVGFTPISVNKKEIKGSFKKHIYNYGNFYWETTSADKPEHKIIIFFSYRSEASSIKIIDETFKKQAINEFQEMVRKDKMTFERQRPDPQKKLKQNMNIINFIE